MRAFPSETVNTLPLPGISQPAPTPGALGLSREDLLACALITALWILAAFAIGIHGEFPLNDDWAHAKAVEIYLKTGEITRLHWTWIPLISHTVIGGAFCKVLGYSFQTLRICSLSMGWIGLLGTYALCRQFGASARLGTFATLLVAFNPLYFNLSYTFMTEIPFTALVVWSVLLSLRAIRSNSALWLAGGTCLAIAATLSRQFGLAVPAGLAIALVATRPTSPRRWVVAVLVSAVSVAAYIYIPKLIFGNSDALSMDLWTITHQTERNRHVLSTILRAASVRWMYVGLFFSPLSSILAARYLKSRPGLLLGAAAVAILSAGVLLARRTHLPGRNIIFKLGLGPILMEGVDALPQLHSWFWWLLSMASTASASVLFVAILDYVWRNRPCTIKSAAFVFPVALIFVYLIGTATQSLDRYLVPILPIIAALILLPVTDSESEDSSFHVTSLVIFVLLAAFGVLGTRDYLVRNRERWSMLNELLKKGVDSNTVKGGFEFNAYLNFGKLPHTQAHIKGLWAADDEYVVSFTSEVPGYHAIDERAYRRWLPWGIEHVRMFHRISPVSPTLPVTPIKNGQ